MDRPGAAIVSAFVAGFLGAASGCAKQPNQRAADYRTCLEECSALEQAHPEESPYDCPKYCRDLVDRSAPK